jgi:hypothetical protein
VNAGRGPAYRLQVSPAGRQAYGEPGPRPEDLDARQRAVDLAGDIALEHADGLALGATVFDPALHVVLRSRVRSQACDDDVPERPVGLAVPWNGARLASMDVPGAPVDGVVDTKTCPT